MTTFDKYMKSCGFLFCIEAFHVSTMHHVLSFFNCSSEEIIKFERLLIFPLFALSWVGFNAEILRRIGVYKRASEDTEKFGYEILSPPKKSISPYRVL